MGLISVQTIASIANQKHGYLLLPAVYFSSQKLIKSSAAFPVSTTQELAASESWSAIKMGPFMYSVAWPSDRFCDPYSNMVSI
jgi:hypothetical protein